MIGFIFSKIETRFDRLTDKYFKSGYDLGFEEGIRKGMAANFEKTDSLSDDEYKEVMEFLASRNLELCCYDPMKGGFRVRKRQNNNE